MQFATNWSLENTLQMSDLHELFSPISSPLEQKAQEVRKIILQTKTKQKETSGICKNLINSIS